MPTAAEIARIMANEIQSRSFLDQKVAVRLIRNHGGEEFLYKNQNRNWAIAPEVLERFNELTAETVVWAVGRRRWRNRKPTDPTGRAVKR